jgi:hypothetical protein
MYQTWKNEWTKLSMAPIANHRTRPLLRTNFIQSQCPTQITSQPRIPIGSSESQQDNTYNGSFLNIVDSLPSSSPRRPYK